MDGGRMGLLLGSYSSTGLIANDASTQEVSYEIGAISAETQGGGVRVNIIPKRAAIATAARRSAATSATASRGTTIRPTWRRSRDEDRRDLQAVGRERLPGRSRAQGQALVLPGEQVGGNEKYRTDTFWEVLPTDPRYLPNKFVADTTHGRSTISG